MAASRQNQLPKDRLLPKITTFFFDRAWVTAVLWVVLVVFGALCYTTLLPREGFPSVNVPLAIVNGSYAVNDPAKVDKQIAAPITSIASKRSDVSTIQAKSTDNFVTITIQYTDGTDAQAATKSLEQSVASVGQIPASARLQYNVPHFGAIGPSIQQVDAALSFYSTNTGTSLNDLVTKAQLATKWLKAQHLKGVSDVFVLSPYTQAVNPQTGQPVTIQQNFDRFGIRNGNQTKFYPSVLIGVSKTNAVDAIKLDDELRSAAAEIPNQFELSGYHAEISASFATNIKPEISELQRVLLEGLIAILVVGSIVITIRASFITVISLITVLLSALAFLYAIGYTLNVITLFALILSLALIVDDTIIIIEAIDAARQKILEPREAVKQAATKVSRAMVAATATASLSFAPLLFVGGILGSFIRAIPITIISALIISLLVALIFIPFFAKFLVLTKKHMGPKAGHEVSAGFEARLAAFIAAPMIWARHSKAKLFGVGTIAILIGLGFLGAGIFIAKNVVFNIFPPTKNTNTLALNFNFPAGTTVQQAEVIAARADQQMTQVLGSNFVESSYYNSGNAQLALEQIQIISYSKRKVSSPQLVSRLQQRLVSFKGAQVIASQVDVGPPAANFLVQVKANDRAAAFRVANDLAAFMKTKELKRISGKTAHFVNITISSPSEYDRYGNDPVVLVSSGFDGNDTSTLDTLAQNAIKQAFDASKLSQYGLASDAVSFNLGFESQNQNSFKTLLIAFPFLLLAMYLLLAFQFRSLLQPLLIFMAIPFSIFGVMLGLDLTHNAISFFSLLGFFALLGLSIKNTILLTDFANQARRSGLGPIEAAHAALEERFRPLFATSMTAVVSLIPLAITSPFWQGLAVVLIFGLLSSTFLVVTVFPYYYLGAEYLRLHISTKHFFIWFLPTVALAAVVTAVSKNALSIPILLGYSLVALIALKVLDIV